MAAVKLHAPADPDHLYLIATQDYGHPKDCVDRRVMTSRNMETYNKLKNSAEFASDLTSEKSQQAMLEAFTPDFEVVEPPSLPHGGVWKGADNWLKMHHDMRSNWQQKVFVEHVWEVPEDDVIVLYSTMEWTANATGRSARSLPSKCCGSGTDESQK